MAAVTGTRSVYHVAGVLLVAAAVVYSAWLAELVLPTGLSPVQSFASENAADGRPYQTLFRATDVIAGVLLVIAVVPLRRALARHAAERRWALVAQIGLGTFGAATIIDASFTLDCVTSIDAACRRRELVLQVSPEHLAHLTSSTLAEVGALCSLFALARLTSGVWRRWSLAFLWTGVVGSLGSIVLYDVGGAGLLQRVELLAVAAAMVTGGVLLISGRCRRYGAAGE